MPLSHLHRAVPSAAAALAVSWLAAACAAPVPGASGRVPAGSVQLAHPARAAALSTLAGLTLEQEVGQLFMVGGPATGVTSATTDDIRDRHIGNVILTGRSDLGVAKTASIATGLQALATSSATGGVPLLISADQEGGNVQVLRGTGFSTIPTALTQGTYTAERLRSDAAGWGRELAAAGIDVDLAPVLDTVPSAAAAATNTPIGYYQREFGYTAAHVAVSGDAFLRGLADADVLATVKHFPGLGRVTGNTDVTAGVTDAITTRYDPYVTPFGSAVFAGTPMLMISTAYYSKIDPANPAAFSATVIGAMVRGDLGFTGVVISDDLANAKQVAAWSPADRALKFLTAGGDMVLSVDPVQTRAMYDAVLARAKSSTAFRAQVDEAAQRVLTAKNERAHHQGPARTLGSDCHGGASLAPGSFTCWVVSR